MRSKRAFTLTEILVALTILGLALGSTVYFLGVQPIKQSKTQVGRQEAKAIQNALEWWLLDQPSISQARATFNSNPLATAPADHLAFYNTYLAQYLDSVVGADIAARSTATQLTSTDLASVGGYMTIYWDVNYTQQHPKVVLTIP